MSQMEPNAPDAAVRRDFLPHQGRQLQVLSVVSLVYGVASFLTLLWPPWSFLAATFGLVGVALGLVSAGYATQELTLARDGVVDRDGIPSLRAARRWGLGAAYISLVAGVFTLLAVVKVLRGP